MLDSPPVAAEPRLSKSGPWWEIVLVMALYLGLALAVPSLRELLALPLIVYMVIESRLRHRTWAENGFGLRTIPSGFAKTWGWIVIVVFVAQTVWVLAEKYLFPEVYAHVVARVPLDISSVNVSLLITLAIATFLEELIFRALFQNRLTAFVSPAVAIVIASLVFAVGHFWAGPPLVVAIDLFTVFVDSVLFGMIYQRSQNVFVSWVPHFLADVFAIVLMISIR